MPRQSWGQHRQTCDYTLDATRFFRTREDTCTLDRWMYFDVQRRIKLSSIHLHTAVGALSVFLEAQLVEGINPCYQPRSREYLFLNWLTVLNARAWFSLLSSAPSLLRNALSPPNAAWVSNTFRVLSLTFASTGFQRWPVSS